MISAHALARTIAAALALCTPLLVSACGGSSSSAPRPLPPASSAPTSSPGTGATPPASLAGIAPAPGVPTVPPTNAPTLAPVTNPSPIAGSPPPSAAPGPSPGPSDIAAMLAGQPPSNAYFAAITASATASYVLPASTPKAVAGTITSFLSDGFVLAVIPPVTADGAAAAGIPYVGAVTAVGAAIVTAHVSSATLDLIPGGFARLRTGDAVLLAGSGDPAAFAVSFITVLPGHPSGSTQSAQRAARSIVRVAAADAVRHPRDSSNGNVENFNIQGTTSLGAVTFPPNPTTVPSMTAGCVTMYATPQASVGLGQTASYPMQLQDISDGSYLESANVPLPAVLVNGPSVSTPTYQIVYGLGFSVGFNVVLKGCDPTLPDFSQTYALSIMTIGQSQAAQTLNPLPGLGDHDNIGHVSCPFVPLSFGGGLMSVLANAGWSPSISFCADYVLVGGYINADASITNAMLTSANDLQGPNTWTWQSSNQTGNSNTMLIPQAAPDGSELDNFLKLQNVSYQGTLQQVSSLQFGLLGSITLLSTYGNPIDSIFNNAAGTAPKTGITDKDPIPLILKPHESNINVVGK